MCVCVCVCVMLSKASLKSIDSIHSGVFVISPYATSSVINAPASIIVFPAVLRGF
jgi:hypothetical protein